MLDESQNLVRTHDHAEAPASDEIRRPNGDQITRESAGRTNALQTDGIHRFGQIVEARFLQSASGLRYGLERPTRRQRMCRPESIENTRGKMGAIALAVDKVLKKVLVNDRLCDLLSLD